MGATPINAAPKIILKLDNLTDSKGVCKFSATIDYLAQKQLKAGLGAIADGLDSTALKTLHPYLKAKNSAGENLFESGTMGLIISDLSFRVLILLIKKHILIWRIQKSKKYWEYRCILSKLHSMEAIQ